VKAKSLAEKGGEFSRNIKSKIQNGHLLIMKHIIRRIIQLSNLSRNANRYNSLQLSLKDEKLVPQLAISMER